MTRVDRDGFERLQLKYDEPLSSYAFSFNLCRYSVVGTASYQHTLMRVRTMGEKALFARCAAIERAKVGRCKLTLD